MGAVDQRSPGDQRSTFRQAALPSSRALTSRSGRNLNYVINTDGTGLTRLPGRVCKHTWPGFAQRLSWSPDGSMISYSGGTGPADCTKTSGIYIRKLDGSPAVRVAYSPAQFSRPLWRPTT